ncbi:uncharacterized protein H6S33_013131 [Morchella sextelata]|uniref:uncharacterized protein n=1 Tax=Morchella sextelata TaxID=1174677 RepID=UPI001D039F2B|nr:uncharacterized protein H6S33_013131 [Morchella sextelata]KAH0609645.1 hypothetical protein H6S33_013131 [Morchella sextelata]
MEDSIATLSPNSEELNFRIYRCFILRHWELRERSCLARPAPGGGAILGFIFSSIFQCICSTSTLTVFLFSTNFLIHLFDRRLQRFARPAPSETSARPAPSEAFISPLVFQKICSTGTFKGRLSLVFARPAPSAVGFNLSSLYLLRHLLDRHLHSSTGIFLVLFLLLDRCPK